MIKKHNILNKSILISLLLIIGFSVLAQRTTVGNLLVEAAGEIPSAVSEKLDQYNNIRTAGFADWDATGNGLYIVTRFADVAQIHHVSKPGAYREQITFFKEPVTAVSKCPNPGKNGFLFSQDIGGNENYQIYYFDIQSSVYTMLTDGKSRNTNALWNKKGDKIAFATTKRTGKDLDFYIAPLSNPSEAKLVKENKGGGWLLADWSNDGNKLIAINYTSINESKIYLIDIATGKMEEINPSGKQISYSNRNVKFSKDGKGIFLTSDEDAEFLSLWYFDFTSKKMLKITNLNYDVDRIELAADGSKLVFVVNDAGYSKPYLLNIKTMKYSLLNLGANISISNIGFNKDNNRVAFTINTPTQASEVFVHNLKTNSTIRWTFSETAGLNPDKFSTTTLIEYPTFDKNTETGKNRMIPSFLVMPKNTTGKLPVLISIHGGPEGQSRANFNVLNQYLANELGIAVLLPNVRGSAGYGKTYLKLDNGKLRENSVNDIGSLLDWIATQPNLDVSRVAVYGGSYGGYMSLACMTHYNSRLTCGIDLFGISNFVSFLKNTSGYRADLRRVEYGDERDIVMAEFLTKISPLTNIKNITKPMFIYQGENDPRVPLSESEQMVTTLKQNGVAVSYIRAKDEGHGLAKKANRDYIFAAMAVFLKKHLVGEGAIQ
ncbi:MAG: S9 family peptidase [Chitinophagaceae bacterium]|jgi:dipeptidyl aminopeptidase/acylaminoacyl peptidase|nr:S9 family peptidase [Chitinophagaceae bacterium]MBP6047814.1 S9 family peptidase [Ferruginibacter sp.]NMD29768.1 S9 family peptidase [Bacteroidota bacterium]MBK9957895.1 S9 family peptidase [Chitinophagaceae bacterium]MBP7717871.1 S9 family peptidase [Ferruginibacter sp.]